MKWRRLIIACLVVFLHSTMAQAHQWAIAVGDKRSGSELNDICEIPGKGFLAVGRAKSFGAGRADAWVLGIDRDGSIAWQYTYGTPDDDTAVSIQRGPDNQYFLSGESAGAFWLLKIDMSGQVLWERSYRGITRGAVWPTVDGGCILSGSGYSAGVPYTWVLKLDSNGTTDVDSRGRPWQRSYNPGNRDIVNSIIQTRDGQYVIAGSRVALGRVPFVMKLGENGEVRWYRLFSAKYGETSFVRESLDGGYILGGEVQNLAWLVKLEKNGNVAKDSLGNLWQKMYGDRSEGYSATSIQVLDRGYVLSGNVSTDTVLLASHDPFILRLDDDGAVLWHKRYQDMPFTTAFSILEAPDRHFVIAGFTRRESGQNDAFLAKIDDEQVSNCMPARPLSSQIDTAMPISPPVGQSGRTNVPWSSTGYVKMQSSLSSSLIRIGPDLTANMFVSSLTSSILTLRMLVSNQDRNCEASATSTRLYLSADANLDNWDSMLKDVPTPSLPAGSVYGYPFTVDIRDPGIPSGRHYLIMRTDSLEAVSETDETNNTWVRQVIVLRRKR